jgi:hypothetical protein
VSVSLDQFDQKEENQPMIDDQSDDVGGETEYETESDADCDETICQKAIYSMSFSVVVMHHAH